LGEIRLGEMGLGEMGLGEMGQNHQSITADRIVFANFAYSIFRIPATALSGRQ